MKKLYAFNTNAGVFYIAEDRKRFHPIFRDQSLGSYATAQQAVEDLAGGHTFSLPAGISTDSLDIPADLNNWERLG